MEAIVRAFVLLLASGVIVNASKILNNEEIEKVIKDCQKESGFKGSIEDIKKETSLKEAKCFLKCIDEAKHVLKKDGTFDVDVRKQYIENDPRAKSQPELKEKLIKFADECAAEVKPIPDDLCETAYKFYECNVKKIDAPK